MQLSETIAHVIPLVRRLRPKQAAFQARVARGRFVFPLSDFNKYPRPVYPEKEALRQLLDPLSPHAKWLLVYVMYVGLDGYCPRQPIAGCRTVSRHHPRGDHAVDQLLGKTHLADHLVRGLRLLNRAGHDVDQLLDTISTRIPA